MPITLDTTISGTASNSYVSAADATAYFANRLWATSFTGATADQQAQSLIMATQRIDQERFLGTRAVFTQALRWPRWGVQMPGETYGNDPGGYYGYAYYYPVTSIPQPVKDATCEYALLIIGSDVFAQQNFQNFKHLKVGPIEIELNQPVTSGILPDQVSRLLRGLRTDHSKLVRA